MLLVGAVLVVPVAYLLRYSVSGGEGGGEGPVVPLEAYQRILTDGYTLAIIGRTFLISAIVTIVAC